MASAIGASVSNQHQLPTVHSRRAEEVALDLVVGGIVDDETIELGIARSEEAKKFRCGIA